MTRHIITGAQPTTHPHEKPVCGRCVRCHPGRAWGGDEACVVLRDARPWKTCPCHRDAP